MGVFTQVEIGITFTSKVKAEEFATLIENFNDNVRLRREANGITEEFYTNITEIDVSSGLEDDAYVLVKVNSARSSNAEFQATWVSNIAKEFKEYIGEFNADIIQPETIIYWNGDEDEDEE